MDEITNKALTIGVAIFITIAITSGLLIVIDEIKEIYGQVYGTDISIQSGFSEFESYDNISKTGIDVINAIKKYEDSPNVIVQMASGNNIYAVYTGASGIQKKAWSQYTQYINYVKTNDETALKSFLTQIGKNKYKANISMNDTTGITTITFR